MQFLKRTLSFIITLKTGEKITLAGFPSSVKLSMAGGVAQGVAQCQIFGLPLDTLIELTASGIIATANTMREITIEAGSVDANGKATKDTLFIGVMYQSVADFSSQPNVPLTILAYGGMKSALTAPKATSYQGSASIVDIMSDLAKEGGYDFAPYGVSDIPLENPNFTGSTLDKINAAAEAANINYFIDNNILTIYPKGLASHAAEVELSPETGMIGYPVFSQGIILLNSIYNKAIKLGTVINVKSSLKPATGKWLAVMITHSLTAEIPGGSEWMTSVYCQRSL